MHTYMHMKIKIDKEKELGEDQITHEEKDHCSKFVRNK